jgi:hypothetical protein
MDDVVCLTRHICVALPRAAAKNGKQMFSNCVTDELQNDHNLYGHLLSIVSTLNFMYNAKKKIVTLLK